jgi:hypothetical protein
MQMVHDAGQVEERLRAATSWDERFTIAADVLGRRLGHRPSVDPEVACTWRRTVTSRGRVRVHGLADEVGWSRKRLWSRFRSQIGLTPKRAAQLVRFDRAVARDRRRSVACCTANLTPPAAGGYIRRAFVESLARPGGASVRVSAAAAVGVHRWRWR